MTRGKRLQDFLFFFSFFFSPLFGHLTSAHIWQSICIKTYFFSLCFVLEAEQLRPDKFTNTSSCLMQLSQPEIRIDMARSGQHAVKQEAERIFQAKTLPDSWHHVSVSRFLHLDDISGDQPSDARVVENAATSATGGVAKLTVCSAHFEGETQRRLGKASTNRTLTSQLVSTRPKDISHDLRQCHTG